MFRLASNNAVAITLPIPSFTKKRLKPVKLPAAEALSAAGMGMGRTKSSGFIPGATPCRTESSEFVFGDALQAGNAVIAFYQIAFEPDFTAEQVFVVHEVDLIPYLSFRKLNRKAHLFFGTA